MVINRFKLLTIIIFIIIYNSCADEFVSFDSLKVILKNAPPIKYQAMKIESKIFKEGYLVKLMPLTQEVRSEVLYVLNQDTAYFSDLFPLVINEKLKKFNSLVKLNNIKLKSLKSIQEFLSELFSYQGLTFIKDTLQYNELKKKYSSETKRLQSCNARPVYQDSLIQIINSNNNLSFEIDSSITFNSLLFKGFFLSRGKPFEVCTENYPYCFYRCLMLLNRNGVIEKYKLQYMGNFIDIR